MFRSRICVYIYGPNIVTCFCVGIVADRSVPIHIHTFMNTNDIWSILDLVQFRIIKFYCFFCLVIYCNIFSVFMCIVRVRTYVRDIETEKQL